MTPRAHGPHHGEAGFVLIGVVIFVLALTIIGISLFSLSSYEAQFLQRSLDSEQAFQSAVGGMERAKVMLTNPPYALESVVPSSAPVENVIAAVAIQVRNGDSVSIGPVEWVADQSVHLRVTARVNGQQCTVAGIFTPQEASNYYRQLMTTSGRIAVDPPASADSTMPPLPTIDLGGTVWQGTIESPLDTVWTLTSSLRSWEQRYLLKDYADDPDVISYFASNAPSAALLPQYSYDEEPIDVSHYTFAANSNSPTYYRVPNGFNLGLYLYDMCGGAEIMVTGQGCVVWELPAGVRFLNPPHIQGPPGTVLVIVAGPDPTDPNKPAIFFEGGVRSDIPLILVSNGTVAIQHINNQGFTDQAGFSTRVEEIAIYAQNIVLRGPRSHTQGNLLMELRHPENGDLNRIWVPYLAEQDGLPNLNSTSGHDLVLQPGTWHASDR